ncbi:hypothetical protein FB451DRAFT_1220344 [Mycena latifolia]|nr:hypothetical protein FB451DRAFT_1220344 [Mycena latifolia]
MAINPFVLAYGVELASSWLNAMLYMLELVLCFRYFQRSSRRPLAHRVGVAAIVVFDTLCTMAVNANVFLTFLGFLGQSTFYSLSIATSSTITMTYCTASVEQFFLCHLYFVLTRNRVVTILLAALILTHLGFSFAAAIMVQTEPFTFRLTYSVTAVGAILCAVTDILIAACLGRDFILSVTSGAIVASTTLLMMILFLTGNIAFEFFFSCQGRIYALTLLVNFLSQPSRSRSTETQKVSTVMFGYPTGNSAGGTRKSPAPSINSNFSEDSMNKELPPLPTMSDIQFVSVQTPSSSAGPRATSSLQTISTIRFAPAQFASFPARSTPAGPLSASSPQTPQSAVSTPRTLISVPHRLDSLPARNV